MTDAHEHLILKFLSGNILPDEERQLDAWLKESVENRKMLDDFALMWKSTKADVDNDFQTETETLKFIEAVDETAVIKATPGSDRWLKIAASISFLLLSSWLIYSTLLSHGAIVIESHDHVITQVLPDGSTIWLNQNSQLSYEDDFNKATREVHLEGEAFFDVKRNPDKPFVIETGQAAVKVLGTSFNVRAYDGVETEVSVSTGLVKFSSTTNDRHTIALKPGETGRLRGNIIALVNPEESINTLSWKEKRLVFKRTHMEDIVVSLEHYFKVKIVIRNPSVLQCRFTGSFDEPKLSEILESLSMSLDLNISKREETFVIEGEGCKVP